ncbi:MAG: leucine--tRNA ligase [Actinobacteria bacterium]|nr:leucine--tRNA ligase [Actinomycetota bacterium]
MSGYDPISSEVKWREKWAEAGIYRAEFQDEKPSYYVLEMFPYPSGKLHMGHVRNYSIGDCLARFKRMSGFNVLYPMGYDSFGLPAENAARQNQEHPEKWTLANIDLMREQQSQLGLSYDWDREVATCLPDYYRWNQWLFIKLYEQGLVYRKKGYVNWDPVDETVLANEQVIDGKGWRSGADVEKREIEQWYIKITDYAERLLADLDELTGWPERVKVMQRHWIGRNEGTEITFDVISESGDKVGQVPVFTTRPDTLFGVTYLVLAPEHELTLKLVKGLAQEPQVSAFVQEVLASSVQDRSNEDRPKQGLFLGHYVQHPLTQQRVPLYVGDYVLMDYGTGAVMAVPAHDQRDFEFAKAHDLPIKVVIQPENEPLDVHQMTQAFVDDGVMTDSADFSGQSNQDAKKGITDALIAMGSGDRKVTYRLRDWLISRQRCWGTPIPMLYDDKGQIVPESVSALPVSLPDDLRITGTGNPLATHSDFLSVKRSGQTYRRETDTMDTFFDSSWYFFRYCDPKNTSLPFSEASAQEWMAVDQYIGGIEHAVLHLLYARFFTKFLSDLGLTTVTEPFKRLLCQGMVLKEGAKMSKSLGNTVDPGEIISEYGADTARLFILFAAPVERDLDWSDEGVEGAFRFLKRVYRIVEERDQFPVQDEAQLVKMTHKTIQRVTEDIQRFSFNTAISRLMEFVNGMYKQGTNEQALIQLVLLLAPFAPFITESLWSLLGQDGFVQQASWPDFDETLIQDDTVTMVFQVNGKLRDRRDVPKDMEKDDVFDLAMSQEKVQRFVEGHSVRKVIYVPNKLLNLVVS